MRSDALSNPQPDSNTKDDYSESSSSNPLIVPKFTIEHNFHCETVEGRQIKNSVLAEWSTGDGRTLEVRYSETGGFEGYMKDQQSLQQMQGGVSLPFFLSSRNRDKLFGLSLDDRQRLFGRSFYPRVICLSDGTLEVKLHFVLLGGGSCVSKGQDLPLNNTTQKPISPTSLQKDDAPFRDVLPSIPDEAKHLQKKDPEADQKSLPLVVSTKAPVNPSGYGFTQDPQPATWVASPSSKAVLTVENIYSTIELTSALKQTPPESPEYPLLQQLASNTIESLARRQNKTPSLIQEALALASASNSRITRELLRIWVQEIASQELLNLDVLEGLRVTLYHAPIEALDPDDLVRTLKLIIAKIDTMHQQEGATSKLYSTLSTLSGILDSMVDARIVDISRFDLSDPLYKTLDGLSEQEDTAIASEAAYAKQSLVRLPHDESKRKEYLRRGISVAKGLVNLAKAVLDKDVTQLPEAYQNFKEAAYAQEGQKPWYPELRFLKVLVEIDRFCSFQQFIFTVARETTNPFFVGGILNLLHSVILTHGTLELRLQSIGFVAHLFLDDQKWGTDKKVKKGILTKLKELGSSSEAQIREKARHWLKVLPDLATTDRQRGLLDAYLPDNLDALPIRTVKDAKNSPSNELLSFAKTLSNSLTIDQRLSQLRREMLQNDEIQKELTTYIPVLGTKELFSQVKETFSLEGAVEGFFKSDETVLLLLGNSGAGKSTFCRYLERKLWETWMPGHPIPLFISLNALKSPFDGAVKEALLAVKFEENQIAELQNRHIFILFADGYDELKERQNFYRRNHIEKWQAKLLITCRTEYLSGDIGMYRNDFAPSQRSLLTEAAVAPFNRTQIDAYLDKYIQLNRTTSEWQQYGWEANKYRQMIDGIGGLSEMIETPFLLQIVAKVLPRVVLEHDEQKQTDRLRLTRLDLYQAFVDEWFEKSENRLREQNRLRHGIDIKESFLDFSRQLAGAMQREGLIAVEYKEQLDFRGQVVPNKWSTFFSHQEYLNDLRASVPLRKVGAITYAFLHKSLLEYFVGEFVFQEVFQIVKDEGVHIEMISSSVSQSEVATSAISNSVGSGSAGYFDQKIIDDPSILRFLAEKVAKDEEFKMKLFVLIERSKTEQAICVAAANAITILNVARICFSGKDFKGIKIPGADLSYALLDSTDLSYANLQSVNLEGTFLNNVRLVGASMEGVKFGQRPYLQHTSRFRSVAISPDGFTLVSGSVDNTVRIWDFKTGNCLHTLEGHTECVTSVAISPDGFTLVSGSVDITVRIWDLKTGNHLHTLEGHTESVISVAISPNGLTLVSGSHDKTVRIWDLKTGNHLHTLEGHTECVDSVTISPNGLTLVSGSSDNTVRVWDLKTGNCLHTLEGHTECVTSVAISPNGLTLVSGSNDNTILIWDLKTGNCLHTLREHWDQVKSVGISPDGLTLVSGDDTMVRIWDLKTGNCLHTLEGHTDRVNSVAISPDGLTLVSGGNDCSLKKWKLFDRKEKVAPILVWSSHSTGLFVKNIDITGVQGLSNQNEKLLLQLNK